MERWGGGGRGFTGQAGPRIVHSFGDQNQKYAYGHNVSLLSGRDLGDPLQQRGVQIIRATYGQSAMSQTGFGKGPYKAGRGAQSRRGLQGRGVFDTKSRSKSSQKKKSFFCSVLWELESEYTESARFTI